MALSPSAAAGAHAKLRCSLRMAHHPGSTRYGAPGRPTSASHGWPSTPIPLTQFETRPISPTIKDEAAPGSSDPGAASSGSAESLPIQPFAYPRRLPLAVALLRSALLSLRDASSSGRHAHAPAGATLGPTMLTDGRPAVSPDGDDRNRAGLRGHDGLIAEIGSGRNRPGGSPPALLHGQLR